MAKIMIFKNVKLPEADTTCGSYHYGIKCNICGYYSYSDFYKGPSGPEQEYHDHCVDKHLEKCEVFHGN